MAAKEKLVTPVFRVSFPHVFEAHAMEEGKPAKFSLSAIFGPREKMSPADQGRWDKIVAALDAASKEKFKKPWADLPANIKRGLRSCDEKSELDGYKDGGMFANLSSKMRPGLIHADSREEITDKDDFYPGCYARATVSVYAYDMGGGKGVALGLQNLMKVKDGDRLDSRTDAADDFGSVDDRDEEDDPLG